MIATSVNIIRDIQLKSERMAKGIHANSTKARGRSYDAIYKDCLLGLVLESAAATKFDLNVNTCLEDYRYPGTYDHDLVCPITNQRYEVKQSKLVDSRYHGKTLKFHDMIYSIAKDPRRYFDYFIFGESLGVNTLQSTGSAYIYAVISRNAVLKYSKKCQTEHYRYFQDTLATKDGASCTILFKN